MPRKNLTDRFVGSVHPTTRQNYFDTKIRGLALRVTPAGTKSWAFCYRLAGKPSQWVTLGTYPAKELAEARKDANALRALVDDGRDPAQDARNAKAAAAAPMPEPAPAPAAFTFEGMTRLYVKQAKGRKRTWEDDEKKIARYLLPVWGPLPLRDVTRARVHELLDTLVAGGMTVGVNRIQALISAIFSAAVDRGHVDAHPASRIKKRFKEHARDVVLTDEQIRVLWLGLDAVDATAADAIRIRLLTGQRGGEVAGMRWPEVDLEAKTWTMPGERTKNGQPHVVPISETVESILKRRLEARAKDEADVFPGYSLHGHTHRQIGALHGGAFTWKDLRRTMTTRLAEMGVPIEHRQALLNHSGTSVIRRHYDRHTYLAEKRSALRLWDSEVTRIVANREKPRAEVVNFGSRHDRGRR